MKRLITLFWISAVVLCLGASPVPVIPDDLKKAEWLLISHDAKGTIIKTKLPRERINLLTEILNSHAVASPPASQQPPGPPPRPAPDLIIEIRNNDEVLLAQIMGMNHELIGFRAFSISDKNTVAKFYKTAKESDQPPSNR